MRKPCYRQEVCNSSGKNLRLCGQTLRCSFAFSERCHCNQGNDCQHTFQQHGTVGYRQHALFILYLFGSSTGRYQGMETGNSSAGNGYKQNREQILPVHIKSIKCFQITGRIRNKYPNDSTYNHENQKVAVQVVTRLKQRPYRNNTGNHNVRKNNEMPCSALQKDWKIQAKSNCSYQHNNCDGCIHPFIQLSVFQNHSKGNCLQNEQHGGHCNCTICSNSGNLASLAYRESIKGSRNNICKGSDDQNTKQPAEQQEHFLSQLANILFNNVSNRTAFVLYRRVHSRKVLDSSKEYTANQNPQHNRQPSKHRCLNRSIDRTCTGDRCKLMSKYNIGVSRYIVYAIF